MKNLIRDIITNDNGDVIKQRIRESYFKKNYKVLYNKIIKLYDDTIGFQAKLYLLYYNIKEIPKCKICGSSVNFKKFSQGFSTYCSVKCIGSDNDVKVKREDTTKKKYGTNCILSLKSTREKIKKTNLEKYGFEVASKAEDIKEKTKKTNIEKYGVDHPLKKKEILNKQKQTNIKKYGVGNVKLHKEVIEKTKKTNLEKYGFEVASKSECVKEKTKKTNIEKYGVEYVFQSEDIKEKTKKTNLEKYGFEIPSKSKYVKEKITNSNIASKKIKVINYWSDRLNINPSDIEIDILGDLIIHNYCKSHSFFSISKGLLKNRLRYGLENICTKCNPINDNVSIKENEVKFFINEVLNLKSTKHIINKNEIDIFIPEHNLGIEFNGLYWHSEIYKDKKYHLNKTNIIEGEGIQLLHIFEDEWVYKKDIVKSIIKSKIGLFDRRIYARKCEVKEINDNDLIRDFLKTNHLQGFIGSKYKLGLFYENELVSLMTFGNLRKPLGVNSSKGNYEMLRFCNKLNVQVVGGASKLLSYFENTQKPQSIISYADRRYSNGKLYENLGFEFIDNTQPNYFYYNNKTKELKKYYRFNFRKDILIKQGYDFNKTEHEIMNERGFYRIYDSGNKKFIKKY